MTSSLLFMIFVASDLRLLPLHALLCDGNIKDR